MPKADIDYSTTIIYKITCKSPDVNEVYVGHTTNFVQRKYAHKQSCINNKTTNYNCKLYQVIRKHNGWDNWNMEIVNFFNCKDSYEARQKEQEYFVLLKATLNSIEPLSKPKPNNVTINVKKCKEKKIYFCEHCKTRCSNEDTFNKHNETRKHKKIISEQKTLTEAVHTKNSNIFVCEICDFKCCKESNYKKHIETNKHKRVTESNKKMPKDGSNTFVCICGKAYKYRPGLAKHKKTCITIDTPADTTPVLEIKETEMYKQMHEQIDSKSDKELKELVKDLIKQNSELVKTINEIVPKIGTTNNITNNNTNFNLNVFLNEKCKDALNINDFIESLKITLEDLDFSNKNGMVQGISNLMIKGLKELDIHKRPIHCTDAKRDIIYIKDKEKWEKDDNHSKIKNTIVKVANKERNSLYLWVDKNPHWFDSEATQIEYLTMMRNICEPVEDFEKNEKKIIKNIGREVTLDKCAM